ncbi:MAG: hypothetical protein KDD44_07385, partial [Bdellovibrionales bacterium]|nr:hypothetical protein [Bdellovibrionales bacterium]
MRIGIYCAGSRRLGYTWRFAWSLVIELCEYLARPGIDDELVIYADRDLVTPGLADHILLGPVLAANEEHRGALVPASRYFRILPNGARCRILLRSFSRYRAGELLPGIQAAYLSFYSVYDRLDVLHTVGDAPPVISRSLRVTSPTPDTLAGKYRAKTPANTPGLSQVASRTTLVERRVPRRAAGTIVLPSRSALEGLVREGGVERSRVAVVEPGVDRAFSVVGRQVRSLEGLPEPASKSVALGAVCIWAGDCDNAELEGA